MIKKALILFLFLMGLLPYRTVAQLLNQNYLRYIEQYHKTAVEQMRLYKIPASITLAQGLLESGAGESYLARVANNHFGIKVSTDWTGPYVLRDDDAPNEKFRKYKNAEQSYVDHSIFLQRKRYASLFNLKITDYKGWAYGLKRCGYATSPTYAQNLITIIERYSLTRFDHVGNISIKDLVRANATMIGGYQLAINNGIPYIRSHQGDDLKSISKVVGVPARKLRKYNELSKNCVLNEGDIIYLEKKARKAAKEMRRKPHTVQRGESMYSIAQSYGIRLKNLYKMNRMSPEDDLKVGTSLRVR
jgi:LysM repeat protein